jgi:hypothetical protein
VHYCSSECQKKDWKMGHKAICQLIQQASQALQQTLDNAQQ